MGATFSQLATTHAAWATAPAWPPTWRGVGSESGAPTPGARRATGPLLPPCRSAAVAEPVSVGNFAPVDTELSKVRLPVEGSIPSELRGTLLRNGPNPIAPDPANYHWFLGDGMVHAIELRDGEARYRNRWVRTDTAARLLGEDPIAGQPPDVSPAANRAETSIVSHAGKILALYEVVDSDRDRHRTRRRSDATTSPARCVRR